MTCDINKIDSNVTGLAYAEEACLGVLPTTANDGHDPTWYGLEPNSYSNFGGDLATVARQPISATRQNKKGTPVSITAAGGFNQDLTQSNLLRLMQGFFFANARQKPATAPLNGTQVALTAVASSDESFSAASGLAIFLTNHLIKASGFTNANGEFVVTTGGSATKVICAGATLANETPPAAAKLETIGWQFASGDVALVASAGGVAFNVTSSVDLTTLGLVPGEYLFVGGDLSANQFTQTSSTNRPGYARIKSIAAASIVFDYTSWVPQSDSGTGKLIRVYWGTVVRNEPLQADIITRSYNLERQLGEDGVGIQSQYLTGAIANELKLNLPDADKINADLTFIAIDDETRNGTVGVKTGARVAAPGENAFNTSLSLYGVRLAIYDPLNIDGEALFGFVQTADISINNNAAPVRALGSLGAIDVSVGNFEASGTMTALFSTVAAIDAVRNNADVGFSIIAAQANAGFVVDMPLLGLSGAQLAVELNKPITVPLTAAGAENALGYTLLSTWFPYLPNVAMPT